MPDRSRRLTLSGSMLGVAGAALACALVRRLGPGAGVLAATLGLTEVVARWGAMGRERAALWTCAGYPWLAIGVAFGLGGLARRCPGEWGLAGPVDSLVMPTLGFVPRAFILNIHLSSEQALGAAGRGGPASEREVNALIAIPLISWGAGLVAASILMSVGSAFAGFDAR